MQLKLKDVRRMFRLVGEIRTLGADPARWRPHMVRRLRTLLDAEHVISSEIYVRRSLWAGADSGRYRIRDIGWGIDGDETWRTETEQDERPVVYRLSVLARTLTPENVDEPIPVAPVRRMYGGSSFILSQYPLPHLGAIDQLGLHRARFGPDGDRPFTPLDHKLVRLFHVELGRLWKTDALKQASDPTNELPPRLSQTLTALQAGSSEKQIAVQLGISRHTVHNYVKVLHQRLGVSSRGELLAKVPRTDQFTPKLSVDTPAG